MVNGISFKIILAYMYSTDHRFIPAFMLNSLIGQFFFFSLNKACIYYYRYYYNLPDTVRHSHSTTDIVGQ